MVTCATARNSAVRMICVAAVWPIIAYVQRVIPGQRNGYASRRLVLRERKKRGPTPSGPATTPHPRPYPLRVRNVAGMPHKTWAAYVTAIRNAARLSRAQLAQRLVDPTTVWRWETGRQKPESPAIPQAIADLFHLDVDEALAAAGLTVGPAAGRPTLPEAELDPDLELVKRRLEDPKVSEEEKRIIRATLQHLANLADLQPPRKRAPRKKTA